MWDALLNEGPKILYRVALALLKLHEPALLAQDNPGDLLRTIRRAVVDEYDRDELMSVAFEGVGSLSMGKIKRFREVNQKIVDTEFAERQTRTNLRKALASGFVLEEQELDILREERGLEGEDMEEVQETPKKNFSLKGQLQSKIYSALHGFFLKQFLKQSTVGCVLCVCAGIKSGIKSGIKR